MSNQISIEAVPNIPYIEKNDDLGEVLIRALEESGLQLSENDILCVASKVVSIAEGREVDLNQVQVSDTAQEIHERVPRKDPRTIQLMIDETDQPDGSGLVVTGNHIAGRLPNGLKLTSAGVDKKGESEVYLLPESPDNSAKVIGRKILEATSVNVGVIITDSDGREDKKGSTQIAIGVYGVPPLRVTEAKTEDEHKVDTSEETLCDMLAASAALIMGQRGTNRPVVLIRGVDYEFKPDASIIEALNQ